MKMLMLASVASMIDQFNMPNIKMLLDMGYWVDVACNFLDGNTCSAEKIDMLKETLNKLEVKCYQVDFSRKTTNVNENITAYKQVKELMKNNHYDFVHCHSPIGGLIARLAGKATNTKIIYTAHGFHFYKGAPLINWLVYYPIEWICSHWTDVLITINKEDNEFAKKHMHAKKVVYIPGVGIDSKKMGIYEVDTSKKRKELGIPLDATLLISVGELNENKNHSTVIKAISGMDVHYIIAGIGDRQEGLRGLIDYNGMTDKIHLLGYRNDANELYKASDIFVFPSYREGLSVSLMEAMACELPCVASKIRGNTDLIDENGGILCDATDVEGFSKAINKLIKNSRLRKEMGEYNKNKIKGFSLETVAGEMKKIYAENLIGVDNNDV